MIEAFVTELLARFGVRGVSTVALLLLVSLALYAHKASKVGAKAVTVGSTASHDAKVVAVVLAGLLVLGVLSADVDRAREVARMVGQHIRPEQWLETLARWVS